MERNKIQEWDDEDNNDSYGTESISEDTFSEIREISRDKGWLSRDNIIKTIPDEKIIERIRDYRGIIRELETELSRRSITGERILSKEYFENVTDVGSFRFLDSETYFTLGRPNSNNKKGRTRKGNGLATGRKSMAVKTLRSFINKLTLTEDEKVNLLEEWEKITKGE